MELGHFNGVLQIDENLSTSGTVFHFESSSVTTPCASTLPAAYNENNDKIPETTRTSCLYSQIMFPFGHVRGTGVSMQETYRKLSCYILFRCLFLSTL